MFFGFLCIFTLKFDNSNEDFNKITTFHTNDVHGNVVDSINGSIGLDYISALKNNTANSLLVDACDPTQGFSLTTFSEGKAPLDIMKLAGYDGMTLGNHEFDYGLKKLEEKSIYTNSGDGAFPMVSANVLNKNDNTPFLAGNGENNNGQYFIKEKTVAGKNIKLGFFGLTTISTKDSQNPINIDGIIFQNEFKVAKSIIETLKIKEEVGLVIGITHMGSFTEDENYDSSHTLIQKLQKEGSNENKSADYYTPNIIIDGHTHTKESKVISDGGEPTDANEADLLNNITVEKQIAIGRKLDDILSDYIAKLTNNGGGSFTMPSKDGRITLLNESTYFDNFNSQITVLYNNELLKNTNVDVYLNDSYFGKYITDKDGIIILNDLFPTAYNVTVIYNGVRSDNYIDGRTGITGDTSLGSVVDLGGTLKNTTISLNSGVLSYQDSNKIN